MSLPDHPSCLSHDCMGEATAGSLPTRRQKQREFENVDLSEFAHDHMQAYAQIYSCTHKRGLGGDYKKPGKIFVLILIIKEKDVFEQKLNNETRDASINQPQLVNYSIF